MRKTAEFELPPLAAAADASGGAPFAAAAAAGLLDADCVPGGDGDDDAEPTAFVDGAATNGVTLDMTHHSRVCKK